MKLFPADQVFSRLVRERDNWECQRCHKKYQPPTSALHCSHFYSRGKWSTRYDPANAESLCYGCHRYWDKHIKEYEVFKIAGLGQKAFDILTFKAHHRSATGSSYWKRMTKKQAEEILGRLFEKPIDKNPHV